VIQVFLQIHFLTSYHASLLNRDDAGLAKRIVFGEAPRLRVSSQSQKRHWRQWMAAQDLPTPSALRTRHVFDREVKPQLVAAGVDADWAEELVQALAQRLLHSAGDNKPLEKDLTMRQPVLFGRPEVNYFVRILREAAALDDKQAALKHVEKTVTEGRPNFQALMRQAGAENPAVGFEGAMFGRFVTSDILARVDAPVHVAHAFTTHALDTEVDFFTVVDDLASSEEQGAAHANDMELGAGIFYGYVVVDVPLLVSNLTGADPKAWTQQDLEPARQLLDVFVHAVAQVSPGAKLGSTAPYARAECVVLEAGTAQPRSLANSFLKPVRLDRDPMQGSVDAMAQYMTALDEMYGPTADLRRVASIRNWPRTAETASSLPNALSETLAYALGAR